MYPSRLRLPADTDTTSLTASNVAEVVTSMLMSLPPHGTAGGAGGGAGAGGGGGGGGALRPLKFLMECFSRASVEAGSRRCRGDARCAAAVAEATNAVVGLTTTLLLQPAVFPCAK